MPPDPPRVFLVSYQLQISSAEKKTLKINVEIMTSSFKISRYSTAGPGCRWKNLIIRFGSPPLEMFPPLLLVHLNIFGSADF